MTNIICNECETVAHCVKNGCVPKQLAYRAVKTYYEGKPVYVAEQPVNTLEELYALSKEVSAEEAMKLALEALTKNSDRVTEIRAKDQAITALREALASEAIEQPAPATQLREQEPLFKRLIEGIPGLAEELKALDAAQPEQEPVAWMYQCSADNSGPVLMQHKQDWAKSGSGLWTEAPLYTATPAQSEWVGLTDEEIKKLAAPLFMTHYWKLCNEFARAIEAKLKELNT